MADKKLTPNALRNIIMERKYDQIFNIQVIEVKLRGEITIADDVTKINTAKLGPGLTSAQKTSLTKFAVIKVKGFLVNDVETPEYEM